jgi:YidC/Oxa1 family membrane protein insertase
MDKKTLLAVALCSCIYFSWYFFYQRFYTAPIQLTTPTKQQSSPQNSIAPLTAKSLDDYSTRAFETQISEMQVFERLGTVSNILLNRDARYLSHITKKPVDLTLLTGSNNQLSIAFDDPRLAYLGQAEGLLQRDGSWVYEDDYVFFKKQFQVHSNKPFFTLEIQATFKKIVPQYLFVSLYAKKALKDSESIDQQFVSFGSHGLERIALKDSVSERPFIGPVEFVSFTNRYFVLALVNHSPIVASGLLQGVSGGGGRLSLVYPVTSQQITIPVQVYFGPKEIPLLKEVSLNLEQTIDFGWFKMLAYPLLQILNWFYHFVKNYGVAIVLLTVLLKLVTYPLALKSMRSMKKMSRIQPKLQEIKEKYKDDSQKMNMETLQLIRSEGYNPAAGCLPVLIQIPIFLTLYRVLYTAFELYHAPFFGWIQDLSVPDPYYICPVLITIGMFFQQKITPVTGMDPSQAKVMQLMPIIFGVFTLTAPSGLAIYTLVNTVASIIQQVYINKLAKETI